MTTSCDDDIVARSALVQYAVGTERPREAVSAAGGSGGGAGRCETAGAAAFAVQSAAAGVVAFAWPAFAAARPAAAGVVAGAWPAAGA